ITVYTDGACLDNGKANARCGSGIWFGKNDPRNTAIRIPGPEQSNQVGEITGIIVAASKTPLFQPLEIVSDSRYAIDGLTTHLNNWEDKGWIDIKNAAYFKKATYLLRKRTATTTLRWVKGHNGIGGNEESDRLADEGARKEQADALDLEIPKEFNMQGAKVIKLTQATAYKGIRRHPLNQPTDRPATMITLQSIQDAVQQYTGTLETHEAIWESTRKPVFRRRVTQYMYKTIHNAYLIGRYWTHIPGSQDRHRCTTCGQTESMEHILTQCTALPTETIWSLAKSAWPHQEFQWPEISTGLILGCGAIPSPKRSPNHQEPPGPRNTKGATRLLQILISEAAHLIWVLRCERVIQKRVHTAQEIKTRWTRAINERLTTDKIAAIMIKRNKTYTKLIKNTWEKLLLSEGTLPNNWLHRSEVLVGRRPSP
ncbi:ribonuclease H-like protein, partial [Russula brevipes]